MRNFKGKATFLYPLCHRGRHNPKQARPFAEMYAKVLKTKLIDSFHMSDADVAAHIRSRFSKQA